MNRGVCLGFFCAEQQKTSKLYVYTSKLLLHSSKDLVIYFELLMHSFEEFCNSILTYKKANPDSEILIYLSKKI
jgi:hypothetical protein